MATAKPGRKIDYSPAALETLREIWHWNAKRYSRSHARSYVRFVRDAINTLSLPAAVGMPIAGFTDLRYLLILRRAGSHGHVAVFRVIGDRVEVLRIFHTAQDWQAELHK